VVITTGLPGPVDLRGDPHVERITGLSVKGERTHLDAGEKATVRLERVGQEKIGDIVEIVALPLNTPLDITVRSK
jgi:hypothetical protein